MMLQQLLFNVAMPLAAAVIGGVIAFWGSRSLQNREQKERQRAAGRALLFEVHSNYKGTQALSDDLYKKELTYWTRDFSAGDYYAKTVWRDTLAAVSPLLKWGELEKLASAYSSFEIAIQEIERLRQEMSVPATTLEFYRQPLQHIAGNPVAHALHEFLAATQLLAPKVLKKDERKGLADILGE